MAEEVLVSQARSEIGTRAVRRLRKQGRIPAVIYGHGQESMAISVSEEDLRAIMRHGARVLDLDQDGSRQKVFIRDVQWDAIGLDILHVDLTRVSADERIRVEIRVELRGTAPGVNAGGVLDHHLHSLEVECPATGVPESIRVSITELQLGQTMCVRDLKLPEGVVALTDGDEMVVQVIQPQEEEEEAALPGQAEPEVIGRQREAEGEQE